MYSERRQYDAARGMGTVYMWRRIAWLKWHKFTGTAYSRRMA